MEEAEILLRNAMEHHGAAVYRLALCRMQSVQDAEDVYQDVFLRLLGQEASAWDGEHLRAHPPVLCRGIFHGGDRRAAGHSGGHSPHPAPPGPKKTQRPAGRRRP